MRIVLLLLASVVFLQFAWVYGARIWNLRRSEKLSWAGIAGILLVFAMGQYKAIYTNLQVDWITYLVILSLVTAGVGLLLTIVGDRKKEKALCD